MTDRELCLKAEQLHTELKIALKAILLRQTCLTGYDANDMEVMGMVQLAEGILWGASNVIEAFSQFVFDNRR